MQGAAAAGGAAERTEAGAWFRPPAAGSKGKAGGSKATGGGIKKPAAASGSRPAAAGSRTAAAEASTGGRGAGRRRVRAAPRGTDKGAFRAMLAADVAELVEMGFSPEAAEEALEETGYGGVNAAANWLALAL